MKQSLLINEQFHAFGLHPPNVKRIMNIPISKFIHIDLNVCYAETVLVFKFSVFPLCLDVNMVSKHNPRSEGIFGGRVGRRPWGRTARDRGVSSKDLLVFPCV